MVASLATSAGAAAAPSSLETGISFVYEDGPVAFEHVRQAGARLVQTPLEWGSVAPASLPQTWEPANPADPHYDWSHYDAWVRHAVAAGLTPVLQVRGAPAWAQGCTGGRDSPCEPDPQALATFATAAATRYSGHFGSLPRVRYWQALNEPNLSLYFNPQYNSEGKAVSASLYRALVNSFYDAIKAVDPSDLVLAAGLGPIGVPRYTVAPMQFTRELLCMRGRNKFRPLPGDCYGGVRFDIFDIHPYTTGSPTHTGGHNDVEMGDLSKLRRLLAAADRAGRIDGRYRHTPLWITEIAWDSKPPDPGGLPMSILTRWAAETLYRAWLAGVDHVFWFSLRDEARNPAVPWSVSLESGLYFRGHDVAADKPKRAMRAWRFPFVAYPRGHRLSYWGRTPNSGAGEVVLQASFGGHWRKIGTTRASKTGLFRGRINTRYGHDKRGAVRAVYDRGKSVAFSMRPVPDFFHQPFGG
jgi:hypothetical protein